MRERETEGRERGRSQHSGVTDTEVQHILIEPFLPRYTYTMHACTVGMNMDYVYQQQ